MLSKGGNKLTKQVKNKFITSQLNGQRQSQHSPQLELKILGSFLSFWLDSYQKICLTSFKGMPAEEIL